MQGVPICTLSKTSTTRVLVAFLTSRMKKPTHSCGKRAPRQVIRAGSGGDTGGEKVIVIQAGRRTCSAAAQRLVHLVCRGSTPAHGSLYSKLAKQVGQFLRTRAGAHLHPGSHSRYRKVGKGRVRTISAMRRRWRSRVTKMSDFSPPYHPLPLALSRPITIR